MHVWPNSIKLFHFEEYFLCKRVSGSVTYQEICCLHFIRRKKKMCYDCMAAEEIYPAGSREREVNCS